MSTVKGRQTSGTVRAITVRPHGGRVKGCAGLSAPRRAEARTGGVWSHSTPVRKPGPPAPECRRELPREGGRALAIRRLRARTSRYTLCQCVTRVETHSYLPGQGDPGSLPQRPVHLKLLVFIRPRLILPPDTCAPLVWDDITHYLCLLVCFVFFFLRQGPDGRFTPAFLSVCSWVRRRMLAKLLSQLSSSFPVAFLHPPHTLEQVQRPLSRL